VAPPSTSTIVRLSDHENKNKLVCEKGGYFDCQGYDVSDARAIIPVLQDLLAAARKSSFPVFFTREGNTRVTRAEHIHPRRRSCLFFFLLLLTFCHVGHRPDLSTLSSRERFRSRNNPKHLGIGDKGPLGRFLVRGEPGHDVIPELKPLPTDVVIDKPGRGSFAHNDFEHLLHLQGIKNLILTGVTTDVCVSSTMREANDRGFDCVVLEDATAAATPDLRRFALESVKMEGGIFGAVAASADFIEVLIPQ